MILKMLNDHAKLGLALFMMMVLMLTACPTKNEPTSTPTTTSSTVDPAKLSVEANLDFGKTESEKSFSVKNDGGETLSWTSQSDADWLTLTPASGEVDANQTIAVKVSVNRERLAAGANATTLQLRAQKDGSDISGSPVSVNVKAFKVMPPTVLFEGKDLTNIQADGATVAGEVTVLGSSPITQHGHVWSETKGVDLTKAGDSKTELGELKAVGTFNSNLTGLEAGKTYYVKAYATNTEGTGYSAELEFNTNRALPALTFASADITAIAQTTATASATLTGLGSVPIIQRGHVWSLTPNPTLTTASVGKTELGTTSATGKFSSSLTGLTAERTYYVRAYVYTATDTVYTNLLTLATLGDLNLSSTSIGENSAVGTAVGILSTAGGSGFSYALVVGDGSGDNGSFEVGGNLLKTKTVLDFETKTSYKIRVQSSKGAQTFERAFIITVTNVNEKPTALALDKISIAENTSTGTQIGTFSTTDPDAGDSHTYSFADGGADNGSFQISGNVLQTKAALDYETDSVYQIKVSTKDAGNETLTKDFMIMVTNVNEAPTALALTSFTIPENAATGTQVGTFSTTDVDAGDSHTYELVSGGADNTNFEIDGNVLKTKTVFDYETDSVYNIKVSAKDAGNLSLAQDFMIKVSNVVVKATNILLSTDSIRENNAVGDSVGRLSSAPAESDGVYSLVAGAGDTDNGKFTLAGDTLKANAVFDFETKTTYNIRVRTTNSAGSFEKAFTIRVTDVNEAPSVPTLTSPTNAATDIALNTKLVWQASADPDGDALTYDVYWGTTNPPTTKVVAAKKVLEYTPSGQSISTKYYWKVVANDGSNQTETAVWNYTTTASALRTVTFHLDGEDTSLQVTDGDKLTSAQQQALQNNFIGTKTDSTFIGWFAKADYSGNKIAIKDYTVSADIDLYSRWSANLGIRVQAKEFNMDADNDAPVGITFYKETFYITDNTDKKIYAYDKDGNRQSSKDIDNLGVDYSPWGITAVGDILYVVDGGNKKLYAYHPDGTRDTSKGFNLTTSLNPSYPVDILFLRDSFYLLDFNQRDESFKYSSDGSQQSRYTFTSDDGVLWGGSAPSSIVQFKNEIFVAIGGTDRDLYTFDLTFNKKNQKINLQGMEAGSRTLAATVVDNLFYIVSRDLKKAFVYGTGK